ncbi:carboxypeptidase-like regulatory domain-containing protein [Zeaxanthinibacter enoshimensis]|uniref:carboxypeptidase-like regulatory domain-containing protein n=1 Tax=Zeaxanthinibacter enoshimensis TaxID=392009 RepID=UPI00356ADED4
MHFNPPVLNRAKRKNTAWTFAMQFCLILLLVPFMLIAQESQPQAYTQYKGEVVDAENGKPLVFASISLENNNISTVTNTDGEFSLKVPDNLQDPRVQVSFLGYTSKVIPLASLRQEENTIALEIAITELPEVNISAPRNAVVLVKETLRNKGANYVSDPTLMTAFYRETIKRRRRNVSLSEAVVNIYKAPYAANRNDVVELYKARKSTDYSKLDTLVLKLQGGPYNTLFVDIMKYPDYLFTDDSIDAYDFSFDRSTRINDQLVYVVNFKQHPGITEPMYEGKLYIEAEQKVLTSAIFSLNITNREQASRMFVRKKPQNADVFPTQVAYRVDYMNKGGKWYYGYSNVFLEFKIDWDRKLFNSVYSLTCEMAVTDWVVNTEGDLPKGKQRLRPSVILADEASGFSDPDFWGEYNIIEPEKSIESAIRKIQRQLKREPSGGPDTR